MSVYQLIFYLSLDDALECCEVLSKEWDRLCTRYYNYKADSVNNEYEEDDCRYKNYYPVKVKEEGRLISRTCTLNGVLLHYLNAAKSLKEFNNEFNSDAEQLNRIIHLAQEISAKISAKKNVGFEYDWLLESVLSLGLSIEEIRF